MEDDQAARPVFTAMHWSDDTLAENGITEGKEIEMRILADILDAENWRTEGLCSETVTLNPKP